MELTYQDAKPEIIKYLQEKGIEYNDNKPDKEGGRVSFIINGINICYSITSQCIRLPREEFENTEEVYNCIYDSLSLEFDNGEVRNKNYFIDVLCDPDIENLQRVVETIDCLDLDIPIEHIDFLDNFIRRKNYSLLSGVTFEGTIFEKIKERGSTIGGKFGKMICDASGMDLFQMYAEEYYSSGEIDGIEKDPIENKPISIFECQSGIHKGEFLDDNHLNKALGRYLYDPEIIPTVKKVVILAGGYSKDHLSIIKERSDELSRRETPIEIVLLKTEREENQISIVKVNY